MERRKQDKKTGGRSQGEKVGGRVVLEEEDYGDYVTRCICGFKHDDGYMICCDECSVWQHLECMQVDPKNLPENYLCEQCEPRPVDKRRAHKIQLKKREDFPDSDESRRRRRDRASLPRTPLANVTESRKVTTTTISSTTNTPVASCKKRKKRGKPDPKLDSLKKVKKEKIEEGSGGVSVKRQRRRGAGKGGASSGSSIQSLLTAASLLEGGAKEEKDDHTSYNKLWSAEESPWTDKYESAEENVFTDSVDDYLSRYLERIKSEAVVYSHEEYSRGLGPHLQGSPMSPTPPLCSVVDVAPSRRGLVVREPIPQDELVMEYKGRVSVVKDVLVNMGVSGRSATSLWKQKPCPFVYAYDKMSHLDLCIDARNYGNDARFIRRSCMPNTELRHFFVDDSLHFGVYALDQISPDEEVTLPFDFHHEKCSYVVECGCGQVAGACQVSGAGKVPHPPASMAASRKLSANVTTDDEHVSVRSRSLHKTHSHVFTDDDSNMSWTSTSSGGRRKPRPPQQPQSPGMEAREPVGPVTSHEGGSSDSEDAAEGADGEEQEKPRKSLSREERKTEQVWRVFEKMEATARKKQLLSEGSHESDPASEPSPVHTLPLRTHKDRRLSSSSSSTRRAQMLSRPPHITMRPSSVSSADPLSPYDPSEPFSPPLTPGLPLQRSPLQSPPVHYHVTPQLHPKYLFSSFALPWKKAVLRQWEREQQTGCSHAPRSYWEGNHAPRSFWEHNLPVYGYHVDSDQFRVRPRGCLKHRWLKHYHGNIEDENKGDEVAPSSAKGVGKTRPPPLPLLDEAGSDKENHGNKVTLPHKKLVLLRWKESSSVNVATPTDKTTPTSKIVPDGELELLGVGRVQSSPRKSPLFEEFSDVEDMRSEGEKNEQGSGSFLLSADAMATDDTAHKSEESSPEEGEELDSPCTPPLSALIADRTFASLGNLVSLMHAQEGGSAPNVVSADMGAGVAMDQGSEELDEEQQLSGISDISLDSPTAESGGVASHGDVGVVSSDKAEDGGTVDVSDVSSDSLDGPAAMTTTQQTEPPLTSERVGVAECVGREPSDVKDGVDDVTTTTEELARPMETESGDGQVDGETIQVAIGSSQGDSGLVGDGSGQVVSGSGQVVSGSGQVVSGSGQVVSGSGQVVSGSGQVVSGSGQVVSGSGQVAGGSIQVAGGSGQVVGGSGQVVAGSSLVVSGSGLSDDMVAPPTSPSALPTPMKTPGKRKINLSEYRNRAARRPAERKGSGEKVSTPPNTPGTPAFLSTHSSLFAPATSSSFTPSLPVASGIASSTTDTVPQFEPVSPDEEDHTSKLSTRDEVTSTTLVLSNRGVPPPLGVVSSGGVASLTYSCTPGSNLYNPYASTPPSKGVVSAGVTSGGVLPGALGGSLIGVAGSGIPGGVAATGIPGGVATTGIPLGISAAVSAGPSVNVGGVAGGYGPDGGGRWEDPRARPGGVAPTTSAVIIPGAPHHHTPGGLLQPPGGAVPGINYSTAAPGVTGSGPYPHPGPPDNSAGLFMNQPPRGSAPGGMYPVNPPGPGFFRSQQQQLNAPPPGSQGVGPGMYRPRRPHPSNAGGNNHYY